MPSKKTAAVRKKSVPKAKAQKKPSPKPKPVPQPKAEAKPKPAKAKKKAPSVACPSCGSSSLRLRMGPDFKGSRYDSQFKRWLCKKCRFPFRTAA